MSQFEKFKTSDDAAKHAESCGFEVVRGDEKTLLLDIDSGDDFHKFEVNRDLVDQLVGIEDYTVWNSQSSKHHVKLKLKKPLSIELRLFLQACLGSDIKRELLTYKRVIEGESEPSMLFRPRKWGNKWKELEVNSALVDPPPARVAFNNMSTAGIGNHQFYAQSESGSSVQLRR